ncbi:MAG: hypothetical protein AB1508_16770 [Pseudomonadota bacterium]
MTSIAARPDRAQAASSDRPLSAQLPPTQRARRSNDPLAKLPRRVADLARAYLAALGDPEDIGRQAEIVAAAELVALAEKARSEALTVPGYDLNNAIRAQNAADRALRRLGVKAVQAKPPTLREYIATRSRASAAGDAP